MSIINTLSPPAVLGNRGFEFKQRKLARALKQRMILQHQLRHITQFSGGSVPNLDDDGFVLQSGYFVVPEKLELHVRWSRISGNSGTLGLMRQSSDEVAAGIAWFMNGHNAKLLFDVNHFNGVPLQSNRLDVLVGDIGWLLRTQLQVAF